MMHLENTIVKADEQNYNYRNCKYDKENMLKLTVKWISCDSVLVFKMKAEV